MLQLISCLEKEGVLPVPIFISGVEAHVIVRDLLTSTDEQAALAQSRVGAHGMCRVEVVRAYVLLSGACDEALWCMHLLSGRMLAHGEVEMLVVMEINPVKHNVHLGPNCLSCEHPPYSPCGGHTFANKIN